MENWLTFLSAAICVYATTSLLVRQHRLQDKENMGNNTEHKTTSTKNEPLEEPKNEGPAASLVYLTKTELKVFNGVKDKPIYIALKGKIFDVSSRADFYGPEGGYHLFAGHDATRALAKMSFEPEELEQDDYDDLKFMERETLNDWVVKFEVMKGYPIIGRVLKKQDLTRSQVEKMNGEDDKPIYVVLKENIYDVTLNGQDLFGAEGKYAEFAGKDVSQALTLSNDQQLMDSASAEITPVQIKTLDEWEKKFVQYAFVGKLLD